VLSGTAKLKNEFQRQRKKWKTKKAVLAVTIEPTLTSIVILLSLAFKKLEKGAFFYRS
jgi:hypothetical protein